MEGTRETGELLYIDQHILNEIDYKKADDVVPQSWKIDCLKIYMIFDDVRKFIAKTMINWRVEMTAEGKKFLLRWKSSEESSREMRYHD